MMASGGPIDYSYSPSGSTIELIDLASNRQSSRLSSRSLSAGSSLSWHPKLTLYRLLVILSTVGLAAAKTATTCLNLTFASITVEWILGVAVFLFFHLLGVYEETSNRYFTWLFNDDSMDYLWALLEKYPGFYRPFYISDEIDPRLQAVGIHPPLTGYRIIITLVVAIVGLTKSALLYGQKPKEATTVECVFGVGIVTGLYWLGLYESSSTKVYPRLFHVDYSGVLPYFTETLVVLLHLFGLLFYSALTYGLYLAATMLASSSMFEAREGEGLPKRLVDIIVLSTVFWGTISFLALGSTMGAFLLLYRLGWRYRASRLGQFIARLPGIRSILYLRHKYWLPSRAPLRPRPRFFYLKRLIIRQSDFPSPFPRFPTR
ncbi:hypothetical protein M413DRAFT_166675 [Hebeloma cylindrosporum]|uniref:Uncharacterized protein n=1 Tax=Hebeloma cylindrosporum TaxID=76867 RepID=A0A0C3C932_HEBCY|nr:hypothetical protein M413DRAFT_166675 [Hebeloma cylindrosporum h7]